MTRTILTSLFLCIFILLNAQHEFHRCSATEKSEELAKVDKDYAKVLEKRKDTNIFTQNINKRQVSGTIPVHVVIVHPTGQAIGTGENLSMDHIMSQIDVLNQDFTRTNSDAGNTPSVFSAVNTGIEFCLATVDPNGNPTDGVTRYPFNGNFDNNETTIKLATTWDHQSYMNIWVAELGGGLLGYAYFPGAGPSQDGVVITTGAFGGPGYATSAPYNLGRTATHEVGHYLGLNHTFVGGCGGDDGFSDTPLQQSSNFGCPNHPSPSCGNSGDMFMNYMDYVNDNCMNAFTSQQSAYMNNVLSSDRSGLFANFSTACAFIVPMSAQIIGSQDPLCFEGTDGYIEVLASGGQAPFSYEINGSGTQSSPVFTDLPAGFYEIIVYDNGGQSISLNIDLFEPDPISIITQSMQNVLCNGQSNGFLELAASGGSNNGLYQYSLDNGPMSSQNLFNNLSAGTYEVLATDDNGCTNTASFEITEPSEVTFTTIDTINNICFEDLLGGFNVVATGGTATIMYALNGASPTTSGSFGGLANGNYNVLVTDGNGCTLTANAEVVSPPQVNINIISTTAINCPGDLSTIIVEGSGGEGALLYSIDGSTYQASTTFENVPPGMYELYAQDANVCISTTTATITGPQPIELLTLSQTDVECFGDYSGTIQLEASSATNVTYTLNNITNSTGYFENLTSQSYDVIVTDENNCTVMSEVTINQSSTLNVMFTAVDDILCNNENDGSISFDAMGGSGNYSYSLNGSTFTTQTNYNNLSAGMYSVIVQDESGCQAITEIEIVEPELLNIANLNAAPLSCFDSNDGMIMVNASGGTGGYSYTVNGMSNATGIFNNLSSGNYNVLITDNNQCTTMSQIDVTAPSEIDIVISSIVDSNCDGDPIGAAMTTANGGTGTLSYSLNGQTNNTGIFNNLVAGIFDLTVTDINGCTNTTPITILATTDIETNVQSMSPASCNDAADGSISVVSIGGNGSLTYGLQGQSNTTGTFNNLEGGAYTLVITDADGCFSTYDFEIDAPTEVNINTINESMPTCYQGADGQVNVSASGGTGALSYQLNGTNNTNGIFNNLSAGIYELIITDQNLCSSTSTVVINEPVEITAQVTNTVATSCFAGNDGSLSISAQNGNGSFTYTINEISNTTGNFTNLNPGDIEITVTDATGCSITTSAFIDQGPEISSQVISQSDNICFGDGNGAIVIAASGNGSSYTYELDGISNDSGSFDNLNAGDYTVNISNPAGCSTTAQVTIEEGLLVSLDDVESVDNTCFNSNDGTIAAQAFGSTGYTYMVGEQMNTTGVFTNLSPGTYEILVSDSNGCSETQSTTIQNATPINYEIVTCSNNPDCDLNSFMIMASGGNGPYSYSIDNGSTSQVEMEFLNVLDGDYNIVITDSNGCTQEGQYTFSSIFIDETDYAPQQVRLFPVPTLDVLTLEFVLERDQEVSFTTFDMRGRRIATSTLSFGRGFNVFNMDVSNYANAAYILEVRALAERRYHKFHKMN